MPTPTAHPINPETERLFDLQFGTQGMLSSSNLNNVSEVKQFIAEREHAAEERGYVAGYKDGSATDGKNAAKIWKKRVQALTDKEEE